MLNTNPVREVTEERKKQKENALRKLEELVQNKAELKRHVFFVPGWTDEACVCWETSYKKGYTPIKDWVSRIAKNSSLAEYVTFTDKESEKCKSFFDFGDILKEKIWDKIGNDKKLDIVEGIAWVAWMQ